MIICGFPGVGKSSIARTLPGIVDLESTPFNKNWKIYANVIEHMDKNGYIVLVSSHKELREELRSKKLNYIYVKPKKELKKEYLERYKKRDNKKSFIDQLDKNWDEYMKTLRGENTVELDSGEYLLDKLDYIKYIKYEELKEDDIGASGVNTSSNFSGFAPENNKTIINLINHRAIDSLKLKPKKLPESIDNFAVD